MKQYRCKIPLVVEQCNEDGAWIPLKPIRIEPGMVFTMTQAPLVAAIAPAVHLEGKDGLWLEMPQQTLYNHFEEVSK